MMIKQGTIGGWNFNLSDTSRVMNQSMASQGAEMLRRWQDVFPMEDTWVRRRYGIPSLIVRLDCVELDGDLAVYEVEERPAGIGMTRGLNEDFRQRFDSLRQRWPAFSVVVSSEREKRGDDHLWAKVIDLAQVNGEPVLVRAEPDEVDYRHLSERSISTLLTKGDKSYGVPLGWWTTVKWSDVQGNLEALP